MGKKYIVAPKKSVLTKRGMAHAGAEITPDMLKGEDNKEVFEDLKKSEKIIEAPKEEEDAPKKAAPKKGAEKKDPEK